MRGLGCTQDLQWLAMYAEHVEAYYGTRDVRCAFMLARKDFPDAGALRVPTRLPMQVMRHWGA